MQVDGARGLHHDAIMRIGRAVEALLHARTQESVRDDLKQHGVEVHQTTVGRWILGKRTPNVEQMRALEAVCGRPKGWILDHAGFIDPVGLIAARASAGDEEQFAALEAVVARARAEVERARREAAPTRRAAAERARSKR